MGSVKGTRDQAVQALQADDARAPAAPARGLRRPDALPEGLKRALRQGPRAAAVAARAGKAPGVHADDADQGPGRRDGAPLIVQLDVVQGPGGRLVVLRAAPAAGRRPVGLAV